MRLRFPVLLVVVSLFAAAVWNQHRTNAHERRLGEIASEIAGRPVAINCQGLPSALIDVTSLAGEVMFDHEGRPADEATLKRDVCRDLIRFVPVRSAPSFDCVLRLEPCERPVGKIAYAVHVFTHEAWHLRGVMNEAQTDGGDAGAGAGGGGVEPEARVPEPAVAVPLGGVPRRRAARPAARHGRMAVAAPLPPGY